MSLLIQNRLIPKCYNLKLKVDPNKDNFEGDLTIDLKWNKSSHDDRVFSKIILNGHQLIITKAIINNNNNNNNHNIDLKISYDKNLQQIILQNDRLSDLSPSSQDISLHLHYLGRINTIHSSSDKTRGLFKIIQNGNFIFSTHAQPTFARHILPCIDEPSLKSYFQLCIKTLNKFHAVSVSPIDSIEYLSNDNANDNKWQIVKFEKTILLPVSLFGFTIGDIKNIQIKTANNIPISIWTLNHEPIELASHSLNICQKYLPLVESIFKFPYPGKKMDLVVLPFLNDMVMENFSMITVHKQLILLSPRHLPIPEIRFQNMQMLVHELVHHWIGNFITFDDWRHLWFNESFATWMANCLITANESEYNGLWTNHDLYWNSTLKPVFENDILYNTAQPLSIVQLQDLKSQNSDVDSTTNELFDPYCYHKGIVILRNMELTVGMDNLSNAFGQIFQNDQKLIHEQSIKPMDLWKLISDKLKSENIINFFISWTRLPGCPIVSLTKNSADNMENVKLIQHKYLSPEIVENQNMIEDVPYHVPLLIQLPDGTTDTKNVIMTDRSIIIDYPITLINKDNQANVIVSYEIEESYDEFMKMITLGKMNDNDLFKLFYDLSQIIGNINHQKSIHIDGFLKILNHIGSLRKEINLHTLKYWKSLNKAMKLLEFLTRFYNLESNMFRLNQIDKIVNKLFNKLSWDPIDWVENYVNDEELAIRSSLVFLSRHNEMTFNICAEIFQYLKTGQDVKFSNKKIPIQVVGSVLKCMISHCKDSKGWKNVLDMHKPSVIDKIIQNRRIEGLSNIDTSSLLTSLTMESLGFIPEYKETETLLLDRVINFITSNITTPFIEGTFIGLIYQCDQKTNSNSLSETFGDVLWGIFNKQYKSWKKKLDKETFYSIEFAIIQMLVLRGKVDGQWLLDYPQYATIVQDVQQDITTKKMKALQQQQQQDQQ